MRELLSELISCSAVQSEDFIVLSGDHGYALFDSVRKIRPAQFLNAGVAEQSMVGIAAGLAKFGMRPFVYGLSAFVPIRVLEQIKIDVCYSNLPLVFLGDGAGLVYSTLGASHQCAEDLACLRPMPNLYIYTPADEEELRICYQEAVERNGPTYLRIGKADRPRVHSGPLASTAPHFTVARFVKPVCIVSSGSMLSVSTQLAEELGLACLSIPRLKPFDDTVIQQLKEFRQLVVIEEHSRFGGLFSSLAESAALSGDGSFRMHSLSLEDHFSHRCGDYQFALSEHNLADSQLRERIQFILA